MTSAAANSVYPAHQLFAAGAHVDHVTPVKDGIWKECSNKNQLRYSESIKVLKEMKELYDR